jgi:hypothetical protein
MQELQKINFSVNDKLAEISANVIPSIKEHMKTIIPENFTRISDTCADIQGKHIYAACGSIIYQFYTIPVNGHVIRRILDYDKNNTTYNKVAVSPDGNTLFVQDEKNKQLISIDTNTGKQLNSFQYKNRYISEIITSNQYVTINLGYRYLVLLDRYKLTIINEFKPIGEEDKYCCHDIVFDNDFDSNKILYYADSTKQAIIAVNMEKSRIMGRFDSWSPYGYHDIEVDSNFIYAKDAYWGQAYNKIYKWDKQSSRMVSQYYPRDGSFIKSFYKSNSRLIAITKNKIGIWDLNNPGPPKRKNSKDELSSYACLVGEIIIVVSGKKVLYWNIKNNNSKQPKNLGTNNTDIAEIQSIGKDKFYIRNYTGLAVWKVTSNKVTLIYSYRFTQTIGLRTVNYNSARKLLVTTNTINEQVKAIQMDGSFFISETQKHKKSVRDVSFHSDDCLYTVSHDNTAHKYAIEGLKLLTVYQDKDINSGFSSSILLDNKNNYLLFGNHGSPEAKKETLNVFNKSTGKLIKKFIFDTESDHSTPVVLWKNKFIVGGGSKSLYFIDRSSLKITNKLINISESGIWSIIIEKETDKGYFSDKDGSIYMINLKTKEVTKNKISDTSIVRFLIVNNNLYAASYDGHLYQLTKGLKLINMFEFGNSALWDLCYNEKTKTMLLASANGYMRAIDLSGQLQYSMLNFREGFLWKQEGNDNGTPWFYTDHPELITVSKTDKDGNILEILDNNDPKRLAHINFYNDKRMMNNVINNTTDFLKVEEFLRLEEAVEALHEEKKMQRLLKTSTVALYG